MHWRTSFSSCTLCWVFCQLELLFAECSPPYCSLRAIPSARRPKRQLSASAHTSVPKRYSSDLISMPFENTPGRSAGLTNSTPDRNSPIDLLLSNSGNSRPSEASYPPTATLSAVFLSSADSSRIRVLLSELDRALLVGDAALSGLLNQLIDALETWAFPASDLSRNNPDPLDQSNSYPLSATTQISSHAHSALAHTTKSLNSSPEAPSAHDTTTRGSHTKTNAQETKINLPARPPASEILPKAQQS
jgi:hypothetical protein